MQYEGRLQEDFEKGVKAERQWIQDGLDVSFSFLYQRKT
jgi:hypothetical protein